MKRVKSVILLAFLLVGFILPGFSQLNCKITFKYKFVNVNEGYDHVSRMKVYIDGALAGTSLEDGTSSDASAVHKETIQNVFAIEVPKGVHKIRAVVEALYAGVWEEHLVANTYALDCLYEKTLEFTKDNTIELEFDIEAGATVIIKE